MIDERVKKAHAIFVEALSREGADRDAFVADVCADDESLRGEVNRLLGAVERSTDFLESPAISGDHGTGVTKTRLSIHDVPGYRVLRTLGVGGMASVYEAEQAHPRRLVALKVMHRSLTETSALQRFRFETETLARLKHPGIAQIHEAGTVEDEAGRPVPFFTMELVEGAQPITGYAADANTDLRTRLDMFVAAAHAGGVEPQVRVWIDSEATHQRFIDLLNILAEKKIRHDALTFVDYLEDDTSGRCPGCTLPAPAAPAQKPRAPRIPNPIRE